MNAAVDRDVAGQESGASLRLVYMRSTAASLAHRLVMTVFAVAVVVGIGVVLEGRRHPERASVPFVLYVLQLTVGAAAVLLVRTPWFRRRAGWVASGFGVALSLLLATHDLLVGRALVSGAIVQIGLVVSLCVSLRGGWREQAPVSLAALAATWMLAAGTSDVRDGERAFLIVTAVAAAAMIGSYLFDRQRYQAFVRARLLERASAEKDAVLQAALDAILSIDDAGRVIEANPAAAATFGYDHAALVGRPFAHLVRPMQAGAELRIDDRMRLEAVAIRADGSTLPVEATMAPVRRDGPRSFACTIRDISDRKQVERQLHESKRVADEEAEIASALLYAAETLSTHLNQPYMVDRVTCRAVEAVGCDWGATFVWDERASTFVLGGGFGIPPEIHTEVVQMGVRHELAAAARGIWPGGLFELTNPDAPPLLPPALLRRWGVTAALCVPIFRRTEVAGVLCLGQRGRPGPFSARQRRLALGIAQATATALENARLIADLRTANRLKTEFVSTMSHELRTPLHVILGFAEMAYDVDLKPDQRRECLARIQEAGRALLEMIESTLEIGRLETGRDEVRSDEVSLPVLLDELHGLCEAMPREREVTLVWCERVPPTRLLTDQRKLSIVLRNLIGNALKFTRRGQVRLDVRVHPGHIDFIVADTGVGIRPQDRDAIFEMFRQADQSDSRRFGGTGLGLYIVRRYVEQLGGSIHLESTPGVGSTFTVSVGRGVVPDTSERAA